MEKVEQAILIALVVFALISIADKYKKDIDSSINLPVNVVIVKGELGSERDLNGISKLIENINEVWHQANISFELKDIETVEVDSDKIKDALKGDGKIFAAIDGYDENSINMFFIKNMSYNGISFPEQRIVVMPDKTTNLEHVAAAHELGHVVGLDHNPEDEYLMFSVCNDTAVTFTEILDARKNAKSLLNSFDSMMLTPISIGFKINSLMVLPNIAIEFTIM